MVFIGMDHGTTGISFCIMSQEGEIIDIFKIDREDSKSEQSQANGNHIRHGRRIQ